ncbi:serine/arginine repetitive matrix protein 1-like isoform X2 [Panicum virgatum]|uniref:serine/arginine repetitive matrix protein 1-like isoform X2 n=1 Tax=Panicum virgatum TaxID=38727 RepID=UPI0019D685DE|nr:serine/arginine repetitive matrix protein 1-like isoform X2 [Panicum virgatum]
MRPSRSSPSLHSLRWPALRTPTRVSSADPRAVDPIAPPPPARRRGPALRRPAHLPPQPARAPLLRQLGAVDPRAPLASRPRSADLRGSPRRTHAPSTSAPSSASSPPPTRTPLSALLSPSRGPRRRPHIRRTPATVPNPGCQVSPSCSVRESSHSPEEPGPRDDGGELHYRLLRREIQIVLVFLVREGKEGTGVASAIPRSPSPPRSNPHCALSSLSTPPEEPGLRDDGGELHHRLLRRDIQAVLVFLVLFVVKNVKEETWETFITDALLYEQRKKSVMPSTPLAVACNNNSSMVAVRA